MGEKSTAAAAIYTFSDVVEKACEGLKDRQIKYSIRRIQEMEERLCQMEQELDIFLEKAGYLHPKNREF